MNTKKPKSKTEATRPAENEPVIAESNIKPELETTFETADNEEKTSVKKRKVSKTKVIRDSFSFPEHDYRKISELKKTCLAAGIHVKKSEILRAGLYLLTQANPEELKKAIENVDKVPTGRPSFKTD
ncbi:hypothetical protein QZJ86_15710 [Methylomonas montana]|uniref:hypothetical protein n=1 Tax=Methylomonas montana TaxID=3058963 RepID=UPI0026582C73|nr:hypothetical protein [Methylomonas montana]WKJ89456.1 hypothetical protein QZJ86_15710 [Methylomonas montana]